MAADRLPAPARRAVNTFGSFTPGQKAVTVAAVLALLIGGYFFATWASKPSYGTLFNNLSSKDAGAIVESLQASGTPYELANGGATILVPQDQVYDLRLQLSGEGLPGEADTGYALLDEQNITTSDFMQQVGYQRALEGELSNTIKSIDGVDAATVHLVLPQKDVFADDESKTTASVLVASKATGGLTGEQVQAIVHLVASSVEGLDPADVTVTGADGKLLSTGGVGPAGAGTDERSKKTVEYQNQLNASLQRMLDSVLGPGNSVVTTNAELDFDQTATTTTTYTADPSLPALSESLSREAYTGSNGAATGVLGPDNAQVPGGAGTDGQYENSNTVRNNAINSALETRKAAPGSVSKLNVAVLLNSTVAGTINVADMQKLVGAAAGVVPTRGDTIAVSAMPFDTSAATQAQAALAEATTAEKQQQQMSMIKTGAMVLVVLILIFLAWRASRRAAKRTQLSAAELKRLEDMQAALEMQRLAELNGAIPASVEAISAEAAAREGRERE
ncbi:MAG TPA: flagellar basal-body MS-ring/collar protein FliF, partial [Actinoplanes sp.]|nr:flagellar basal-body MS-ring/collar protein FliF [Actinoplanes sp.]